MAYIALYRKYRPKSFEQLVGQNIITQTLQNSITANTTSHAYMFTGPRGTGKTSAALIFARMINGLSPNDEIVNQPDIIEIDAASNNGVEEIRSIREAANYAPVQLPYKIYIIDEVHMLSTGAFNALLKTLEEPPAQVKFILATTDPQKVPMTILSRVQRFDFKRIDERTIIARLHEILQSENIQAEQEALEVVAKAANGGMRDALSITDQIIALGGGQVDLDSTLSITGSAKREQLEEYLQSIRQSKIKQALEILDNILNEGADPIRIAEDLVEILHNNLLNNNQKLTDINNNQIFEMIDKITITINQLRITRHSQTYLEMLTVNLASLFARSLPTKPLQEPINESIVVKEAEPIIEPPATADVDEESIFEVLRNAKKDELVSANEAFAEIIAESEVAIQALLNDANVVAASDDGLIIEFEYETLLDKVNSQAGVKSQINRQFNQKLENEYSMFLLISSRWQTLRQKFIDQRKAVNAKVTQTTSENPADVARSIFGDDVEVRE